jgi:DNA-binding XRE family transcriptional regulator
MQTCRPRPHCPIATWKGAPVPPGRERYRFLDRDAFLLARRATGLSQREFAAAAGCKKSFLGELEAGSKVACSRVIAVGIARALDRPVDAVFVRVQSVAPTGAADREVS